MPLLSGSFSALAEDRGIWLPYLLMLMGLTILFVSVPQARVALVHEAVMPNELNPWVEMDRIHGWVLLSRSDSSIEAR